MNTGRIRTALAALLCASVILTLVPTPTAASDIPETTTFFTEYVEESSFEEWNARWDKFDLNTAASIDTWCRTTHEYYAGGHAAYCAKSGYNTHYTYGNGSQPLNGNILGSTSNPADLVLRYDTNMDAIMRKYVSSMGLAYYSTVTLTFWFYSDTGRSDAVQPGTGESVGYDFLNVIYYTGSNSTMTKHVAWTDSYAQATARTWTKVTVSIPNTATWVGFEFVSGTVAPTGGDASNAFTAYGISVKDGGMKEGVFLDNISCVGSDPVESVPLVTSAGNLAAYQTNRTFTVQVEDNDPLGMTMEWVYLYYRVNGTGDWTKYTNELKPSGAFVSNTITFTAPSDGRYEFFTQGKDYEGRLETRRNAADATTSVDTAAPITTISFFGDKVGTSYSGAAAFELTSTDPVSGVNSTMYRIDSGSWKTYTGPVGLSATGSHTVEYYSTDNAGNREVTKSATLTISNGSPTIVFQDQGKAYTGNRVTINFAVADPIAISSLRYSLDGQDFLDLALNTTSLTLTGLEEGSHNVTVRATDISGRIIEGTVNFTVGSGSADILGTVAEDPVLLGALAAVVIAFVGGTVWLLRRRR